MKSSGAKNAGSRLERSPTHQESLGRQVFTTVLKKPSPLGLKILARHKGSKWLGESNDPVAGKQQVAIEILGRKRKKVKVEYTMYTEDYMNKLRVKYPNMNVLKRYPRLPVGTDGKVRFPRTEKA